MIQKDKLIAQINAKDIKGFRTLYEQVYPMLVSYVSEIILSDEAAEDIVQDLLSTFGSRMSPFPPSPLSAVTSTPTSETRRSTT